MDVKTSILQRTSSRQYKSEAISWKVINDILDSARYAPSPKNRQPWRFAILTGDEKDLIVKECKASLNTIIAKDKYLMDHEQASESHTFDIIDRAPVLVLVFNAFPSKRVFDCPNAYFDLLNLQAIGAAIENMLLRATELGIGSLWIGDILSEEQFITERYFNTGELVAGVALGVPDGSQHYACRLDLSELVIFDGGKR